VIVRRRLLWHATAGGCTSGIYVARRERGLAAVRPSDGRITPIPVTALPVYLAIDDDGTHLYVSYQGGGPGGRLGHDAIDVYDTKRGAFTGSIAGPPRVGGRMAVSRSGVLLADGEDACWSGGYRSAQADCPAVPGSVFSLIRTSDNRLLATLGYPGSVDAWIGASPDGTRLATGSYTLRVVDISSMHVLEAYRIPEVRRVLFGRRTRLRRSIRTAVRARRRPRGWLGGGRGMERRTMQSGLITENSRAAPDTRRALRVRRFVWMARDT